VRRVRAGSRLWLAAVACLVACWTPVRSRFTRPAKPPLGPVEFPDPLPQVVLPMHDPLVMPDLAVEATLEGPSGKRKTIWMEVDTGATISAVPDGLLMDLGLPFTGHDIVGTGGGDTTIPLASLPRLFLGGLTVERLQIGGISFPIGVLGTSVLERAPWEISWDRGTVTFNATSWPEGGDIGSARLIPIEGRTYAIDVRLNDLPMRMTVDTGSMFSIVPRKLALRGGLTAIAFDAGGYETAGGAGPTTGRVVVGDLRIGPLNLGRQVFVETDGDTPAVLGRPALAAYDLQILPGERLLFKPREPDMRATAAARIARWSWMPACHSVGCVQAHADGDPNDKGKRKVDRVVFEIEAPLPRPVSIVFGCADRAEVDWLLPEPLRVGLGPPYRHLGLNLRKGERDPVIQPVKQLDQLLGEKEVACRYLAVLDVVPMPETEPPQDKVRVWLMP